MEVFSDFHIHSCLSPCADNEMTPGNIVGMAALKGLDAIAIADHNSAKNLPAAQKLAQQYGLLLVPAIEITTKEEVHLLGYFPAVDIAVEFGEMLRQHLPGRKNKPSLFGEQWIMNEDDEIIAHEDALLIGATDLPLNRCVQLIRKAGGVPVPAHINRGANGLLTNLGFMPENAHFSAVEVWSHLPCPLDAQENKHVLYSSDAHYLGDIHEREFMLRLPEKSVDAFLNWLRS